MIQSILSYVHESPTKAIGHMLVVGAVMAVLIFTNTVRKK